MKNLQTPHIRSVSRGCAERALATPAHIQVRGSIPVNAAMRPLGISRPVKRTKSVCSGGSRSTGRFSTPGYPHCAHQQTDGAAASSFYFQRAAARRRLQSPRYQKLPYTNPKMPPTISMIATILAMFISPTPRARDHYGQRHIIRGRYGRRL